MGKNRETPTQNIQLVWLQLDSQVVSALNPMITRLGVCLWAYPLSGNNPGQVVHAPQLANAMSQFVGSADKTTKSKIAYLSGGIIDQQFRLSPYYFGCFLLLLS